MTEQTYGVLHLFCGIGGAALGMQEAEEEYRGVRGNFITLAGIDCDPEACADFEMYTGAPAVQKDLFAREDYIAFHGKEPPEGWTEATPEDLRRATGGIAPDVLCTSPPCKGFSALLPSKSAKSEKYQALNRLTVRGLRLALEAYRDDLPGIILLENVPRITTRGVTLLSEIKTMLSRHGYLFHEGFHECGEIGHLGQRRKRYLLIARLPEKISAFVYQPPKRRIRSIGEVIGPLPMPGDPAGGPMHRLPRLQWKTWVRLALIPAGGDWRDLENIAPEQYRLEHVPRSGAFGVQDWDKAANTVTAADGPNNAAVSVADPRMENFKNSYRVTRWDKPAGTVTGGCSPSNGAVCIADPRVSGGYSNKRKVLIWNEPATTVTGTPDIQSGAQSIADPRTGFKDSTHHAIYRVCKWEEPARTVTGAIGPNNGALVIDDPRIGCKCRARTMGVQAWDGPGYTVTGTGDVHSGAAAVADPRIPADTEQGVWVIIAEDGTHHRPLTIWENLALQGFPLYMTDGSPVVLAGKSESRHKERIGNSIPPPAAKAIGKQILRTLLVSAANSFELSATPVWVERARFRHLVEMPV